MFFKQIEVGHMENFSYVFADKNTKQAACVDPGWEGEKILEILEEKGFTLKYILLTHVHYDHAGESEFLRKKTGAEILVCDQLRDSKRSEPSFIVPTQYTRISPQDVFYLGNISIKNIFAPGHQDDHILFLVEQGSEKYLFTGDTLFIGRIGRIDFPDSRPEEMRTTLQKIYNLPGDIFVCPGHDYGEVKMRKLGEEKKKNPYLLNFEL